MKNFDYSLISKGDVVGVALSGGRDSVALFDVLSKYKNTLDFTLVAINVEHGIRGEESDKDSDFVKNLAISYNVPLFFKKLDCLEYAKQNKLSLEEAGRILRYDFFNELLESKKVDKIALGHHKNDNAETILFNIFRGSGANGASGISKTRGGYIRPLLSVSRDEIDEYVKENALEYVEDSTNENTEYSRNYIRNVLIPKITAKFPKALDAITRFSENISEDEEYLLRIASDYLTFCEEKVVISLKNIPDDVIFKKAAYLAIRKLGIYHEVYKANYDDLIDLKNGDSGKSLDLPQGIIATKEFDKIVIGKKVELPYFSKNIEFGTFCFLNTEYIIEKTENRKIGKNILSFDFDKLPENAIIRTRRDGDVFARSCGDVKLKEYLIDKKIPLSEREKMLFIASDNKILAVLCRECGKDLFADVNSKNFITITSKEKT